MFEFESNEVRFVDGRPIANDVAKILGYANPSDAVYRIVDEEYKGICDLQTPGGNQSTTVLKEPGIYQLIFKSKLESAKKFQQWVFEEVIPQIRKTGSYSVNQSREQLESQFLPDVPLKQINELGEMMGKLYGEAYQQRLVDLNLKKFYPHFALPEPAPSEKASLPVEALLTPTQIAEELGFFYSTGNPNPRKVNEMLEKLGYQVKVGGMWSATPKAKGLCDRKPVSTNSRSQRDQLMWSEQIVAILQEYVVK